MSCSFTSIPCLSLTNTMYGIKEKKYHTIGTVPKYNRKNVEMGKVDTSNTQIHDISLS